MSDIKSYDSFAKLNIMSEVNEDRSKNIPQIMIDLAQNNEIDSNNIVKINVTFKHDFYILVMLKKKKTI